MTKSELAAAAWHGPSSFELRHSFVICHSCFVIILFAPASLRQVRWEFLAETAMAVGKRRHSLRLDACADRSDKVRRAHA